MLVELKREDDFRPSKNDKLTLAGKKIAASLKKLTLLDPTLSNKWMLENHISKIKNVLDGSLQFTIKEEEVVLVSYRRTGKREDAYLHYLCTLPITDVSPGWRSQGYGMNNLLPKTGEIDEQLKTPDGITPLLLNLYRTSDLKEFTFTERMMFNHPALGRKIYEAMKLVGTRAPGKILPPYKNNENLNNACHLLGARPHVSNLRNLIADPDSLRTSTIECEEDSEENDTYVENLIRYAPNLLLLPQIRAIKLKEAGEKPWHRLMADKMIDLAHKPFKHENGGVPEDTTSVIPAAAYYSFLFDDPVLDQNVNRRCQAVLERQTPPSRNHNYRYNPQHNIFEEVYRPILGFRQVFNYKDDSWIKGLAISCYDGSGADYFQRGMMRWAYAHPEHFNANGIRNIWSLNNMMQTGYSSNAPEDFFYQMKEATEHNLQKRWREHLLKTDKDSELLYHIIAGKI